MAEKIITHYHQGIFDKEQKKNDENLRSFVIQETELQMAAAETIHGFHQIENKGKNDHTYFGSSHQSDRGK